MKTESTTTKLVSNKSTFRAECFNFHIFHKGIMYNNDHALMIGCTKDYTHPPISKEELKALADFIYQYLENKNEQKNYN